ncbi:MAG TPA: hypothetical protein DCO80_02140 [Ornithinibacillus sp.]|nr:hypothetical protein [Ornithinibacillus sp.]
MEIYRHKGHTVYRFARRLLMFKNHSKMMFWHKGKLVRNHRFIIKPHKQWRYFHWFIRQPFFYFERNNGGIYLGTPNRYFLLQRR